MNREKLIKIQMDIEDITTILNGTQPFNKEKTLNIIYDYCLTNSILKLQKKYSMENLKLLTVATESELKGILSKIKQILELDIERENLR